ncbi:TPA_inf: hypothetical protein gp_12 [Marinomonas phage YY]|nr:TPA_inf: hypothetical protein gp_12 [Marinomonas phage YY]
MKGSTKVIIMTTIGVTLGTLFAEMLANKTEVKKLIS